MVEFRLGVAAIVVAIAVSGYFLCMLIIIDQIFLVLIDTIGFQRWETLKYLVLYKWSPFAGTCFKGR